MDKNIIIDGVNVSDCISFDKCNGHNICCYDDTREDKIPFANLCVENKDCAYKQLKRLEQENKEFEILAKSLYKRIEELEKENEALAFRERLYKADYEASEQENKELKETVKDLNQSIQNCNIQRTKMYKALEEIKSAIVEYLPKKHGDYNFSKSLNPVQYALLEYIQIQINEVLQ